MCVCVFCVCVGGGALKSLPIGTVHTSKVRTTVLLDTSSIVELTIEITEEFLLISIMYEDKVHRD